MLSFIKGFEGLYSITDTGEVFSHRVGRYMKLQGHTGGYKALGLTDSIGGKHQRYIHRLVAEHYLPNPRGLPQVGHKGDEDKTDNYVGNLYWCTSSSNIQDSHKNGRTKRRREYGTTTHRSDEVLEKAYRLYLEKGNITQAAKQFGMSRTTLSSIVNKRCKVALTERIDQEHKL